MKIPTAAPALRSLFTATLVAAAAWMALPAGASTTHGAPPNALATANEHAGPLADFAGVPVSDDVREVANWAFFTRDNQGRAVVILDKHAATVYAFRPDGKLVASAPALLGLTVGDDTLPGVGDKPLAEVRDEEFYEQVLSPTVRATGAVVYVLPETRSPREVFGSWDVTDPSARPATVAAAHPSR